MLFKGAFSTGNPTGGQQFNPPAHVLMQQSRQTLSDKITMLTFIMQAGSIILSISRSRT